MDDKIDTIILEREKGAADEKHVIYSRRFDFSWRPGEELL